MAKRSSRSARRRAVERRRQQEQRRRITLIVGGVVGVALVGGVVFLIAGGSGVQGELPGELLPSLGNQHIPPPQTFDGYNSVPPTSGPHYGNLTEWGIHSQPIQDELQVHNLEDGGVGIQYDCPDGCPELVAQLTEIVSRYPDRVFLAPYPGMDSTIVLTAWTRIDKFDEFDERRIIRFIEAYRGIDHHSRF